MVLTLFSVGAVTTAGSPAAGATSPTVQVSFRSGDTTLQGTVSTPSAPGQHPALVLVHGAGPETRAKYLAEATALAGAGFVVFSYDKRTAGYSQTQRSYSLLADDALAAVGVLRQRADVDPARVGLWGFSEGGWVAPIAASRSTDVAFLVLVGASGVAPARQQAWALDNRLRHEGVAGSLLHTVAVTGTRALTAAGLFPEANYDPVPALEHVSQPVLALWGNDQQSPPAESAQILRSALAEGGNTDVSVRFFPQAEHKLHRTTDGFLRLDELTPGYVDTVSAWVAGRDHGVTDPLPVQRRHTSALGAASWYESPPAQALVLVVLLGVLILCGLIWPPAAMRRRVRLLASTGLSAVLGLLCYIGYVTITLDAGPVIAGRAVIWLALQALAVGTLVTVGTIAVTALNDRRREQAATAHRWRAGLLFAASGLFAAWGVYWGLLLP